MKLKKEIEPQVHFEMLSYTLNGITIRVKINYDKGHIALVDERNYDEKWSFHSRGLEYMQGWQNILDAMKYAIGEATKKLEKDREEKTEDDLKSAEWKRRANKLQK